MAAFDQQTLDRWRALAIVDRTGTTVGTVKEFYLDRETGHPTWALVNTGLFGASQTFVPLVHVTEIADGLQVPYEKGHIKDAPRVDPHDELTPDEEAALFAHYGVDYQPSSATDRGPGDVPGAVPGDEGPGDDPGAVPAHDDAPGPVRADPGPEDADARHGSAGAVPPEPEPAEPAGASGLGSGEAPDAVPAEPGTAEPDGTMRSAPEGAGSSSELLPEEPGGSEADPSRPVPVEPGLPGSTSVSGPTPTTIETGVVGPGERPAEQAQQPPSEAGWAPGTPGAFEDEPADRPAGSTDRWREAKLAAERDRIAREAAQTEERSPLERARRRLERLVGGGQAAEDEARDAAERARRARLGLDEDDPGYR